MCLLPPELSLLALHRRAAVEGFSEELPRFDWRGGGLSCLLIRGGPAHYGQLSVPRQVVLG